MDLNFGTPTVEEKEAGKAKARETVKKNRTTPDKLPHNNTSVIGLKAFVLGTGSIRFAKTHNASRLAELGFAKLSTITEVFFDEIHDTIAQTKDDDRIDWDDILTYMDEIDGFGLTRCCLLWYCATGSPIPPPIMGGMLIKEKCIGEGMGYDAEADDMTTGNTIIERSVVEQYFLSLNITDCTVDEALRVIEKDVAIARDGSGDILFYADKYSMIGERFVVNALAHEAIKPLGFCDPRELDWYTQGQRDAIVGVLESCDRVVILTGAGGTGKTTTIKRIVKSLGSGYNTMILAPTGAASKRVSDETVDIVNRLCAPISTIHYHFCAQRLIQLKYPDVPNLVIIDEASMVDSNTFGRLLMAIRNRSEHAFQNLRFLLVGDFSQLPPVGPGRIFNDLVAGERCPVFRLTEVKRTSDEDLLKTFDQVRNKKAIGQQVRKFCIDTGANLGTTLMKQIDNLFNTHPEWYRRTTWLAHRNATVDFINTYVANRLSNLEKVELGDPMRRGSSKQPDWKFRGAKVVFTKNDRRIGVVNGSIGYVVKMGVFEGGKHDGEPMARIDLVGGDTIEIPQRYGSIRLAYATSVHKCLPIDTLVRTPNGFSKIGDLSIGDVVISGSGEPTTIRNVFPVSEKTQTVIRTRSGRVIPSSEEHRHIVIDEHGVECAKEAGSILVGETMCLSGSHGIGSVPTPVYEYWKPSNGMATKLSIGSVIDLDLFWLLGVIVGDGCVTDMDDGIVTICKPSSTQVLDKVRSVFRSIGLNPLEHQKNSADYSVYVSSVEFRALLLGMGLGFVKADSKYIPNVVWASTDEYKVAFLTGLIDSDGSMTHHRRVMRYVTASHKLATDLQELLLQLGIQSCTTSYIQRSNTVSVTGGNLSILLSMIKPINENRIEKKSIVAIRDISDTIIVNGHLLSLIRSQLVSKYGSNHTRVRRIDRMIGIYNKIGCFRISRKLLIELSMEFNEIPHPKYIHDSVIAVTKDVSVPMVDIEVDNDDHTFVLGNGIVTHNCQGSEATHVVYVHTNTMETSELVYTAITRAREQLHIITKEYVVNITRTEPERLTIVGCYENGEDPMGGDFDDEAMSND